MKKLFLALLGLAFLSVHAEDRISLAVQESREIQLPFAVQTYKATPQEKIKVDSISENKLLITGLAQGNCELLISGGSISKKVFISVVSNLKAMLKKIKYDLQDLSELDIAVNQDVIVISGSLSKYDKWKYLNDVLRSYDGKVVLSYVKFVPSAETVINLRKTLETLGFKFTEKETAEPGLLCLKMSPEAFFLSGKVFSQGEQKEIMDVLNSQPWLDLSGSGVAPAGKIKGMVNISVVKTQVVVDIAFVGLNSADEDKLGSTKNNILGDVNFGILYNIVKGTTDKTATIGANMTNTLNFLAKSNVTRIHHAGSVSFTNGEPAGGYLKVGGTKYIKVEGVGASDVKEVNYGFIVTVKGTILNRRQIKLDLNLELSHMNGPTDKLDKTVRTSRIAEFDKTAIIGGFREITRDISNSGLPILRNTPVLQWFVAEQGESEVKVDLLVLACPRVYQESKTVQIEIPVTDQVAPSVKEVDKSNKEYKKSKKKYSGMLYWLNWFVW